jgi:hypothetical protein
MNSDTSNIHRSSHEPNATAACGGVYDPDPRTTHILDHLAELSSGLLFMSESDYPLDVLSWPREKGPLSPERVLRITGHPRDTPIEETTLDGFFRPAVTERDGQTDEERATIDRFHALVGAIKEDLTDIHVYRVGTIAIDVYIVGHAPDGTLAGLSTRVIET